MAIEEKKLKGKAPFKERWQNFKEAYFEWAQYNQFKEDPFPRYDDYWKKELKSEDIPTDFVKKISYYDEIDRSARPKYKQDARRRKIRVRAKKARLRERLKRAFLDLF